MMGKNGSAFDRYSRQIVMKNIGLDGHKKIRKSHVTIVGMGGLGSAATYPLVGMGVGTLRVIDQDIVAISNLQRQLLYKTRDVGLPKVEAAEKTVQALNPQVQVEPIADTIRKSNVVELLSGTDVVVDGLDSFKPRFLVNQACVELGIPYVFAGALETYGNMTTIVPGKTGCLECIFPDVDPKHQLTCEQVGVLPTILSVVGGIEANEAILLILGQSPTLMDKLLFIDLNYGGFETVMLHRQEDCPVCGVSVKKKGSTVRKKTNDSASPQLDFGQPTLLCGGTFLITTNLNTRFLNIKSWAATLKDHVRDLKLSDMGIRCTIDGFPVSILQSGNIIIEHVKKTEQALEIAQKIEQWSTPA